MLTCRKCGSKMRGVDMICKDCGTPWGKKHHAPKVCFYILLILCLSASIIYFKSPDFADQTISRFSSIMQSLSKSTPASSQPEPTSAQSGSPSAPALVETVAPVETQILPAVEDTPISETFPAPVFTKVAASSSLIPSGNFTYYPSKVIDSDNSTAWLEGVDGNGINEWISFSSDSEQYVKGIKIFNGYQKNSITYANNVKAKKVKISFSDDTYFEKSLPLQPYNESLDGVDIPFDSLKKTTSIKITILDFYKGSYYTDLAINEIKFY